MKKNWVFYSNLILASLPIYTFGAVGLPTGPGAGTTGTVQAAPIRSVDDIVRLVRTIVGYFQLIIFVYAAFQVLMAAWKLLTNAKDFKLGAALLNIAIAIALALLAFSVEPLVRQLLGVR